MEGKFTLLFEDPFWVGYFERQDDKGIQVARYVFGAEPGNAKLLNFCRYEFANLQFSEPVTEGREQSTKVNFKRRQRELRRQTEEMGIGTYAQRIAKADMEKQKSSRKIAQHESANATKDDLYRLKQEKRKLRKKSH